MDLRLTAKAPATDEERAAVDAVLGPPPSQLGGRRAPRARRTRRVRRARRPWRGATCSSPCCTRCRSASAGSAPARSTTLPSGWRSRRPRRTASRPSTHVPDRTAPGAVVHVCDDMACQVDGRAETVCRAEPPVRPRGHGGRAQRHRRHLAALPVPRQCDRGPAALMLQAGAAARRDLAPVAPDAVWQALAAGGPRPRFRSGCWSRSYPAKHHRERIASTPPHPAGPPAPRPRRPAACPCCAASATSTRVPRLVPGARRLRGAPPRARARPRRVSFAR